MNAAAARSITLRPVLPNGLGEGATPWEGVFLPVSGFPVPEAKMLPIRRLWGACRTAFLDDGQVASEVFLQTNHLGKVGSARLVEHAREWMPELGLGVWPGQAPPALRTHAELQDLGPGERPTPMMYQILQIPGSAQAKRVALATMLGTGVVLEIVTPAGGEAFLQRSRNLLLPPIREPGFRKFPFYVPVFGLQTLESATASQLDIWFCGASAYIRESPQDNGILIVSNAPLKPLFEKLGGEFQRQPEPLWHVPIPS